MTIYYNGAINNTSSSPLNRFGDALQRHWLTAIVVGLTIYSLLPFLAPVLMKAGYTNAAQWIYGPYKMACHTYAFRSIFLFGDQPVYARGNGEGDFERASGIDTTLVNGLFAARDFQGNEQMGYKVALCQRDVAIYLAMALNGVFYALLRRRGIRQMPFWLFLLVGVVPIGLDGFSQLFSQPPFNFIPFRESTWWLRILTGSLFGTSVAWLLYPLIGGAMEDFAPQRPNEPTR